MALKLLPASTRSDCELYDRQTDGLSSYWLSADPSWKADTSLAGQEMPPFCLTRILIIGVKTACCFYLYLPSGCLKIHFETIAHLRQTLLRVLFPSDFPAKFPCLFPLSSLRVTCFISTNHTDAKCSASSSCGRRHEGKGKGHPRAENIGTNG